MQLLQYHQLGALRCAGADTFLKTRSVCGDVGGAVLLHHAYLELSGHYLYLENFCKSVSAFILSMMAQTR